MSYRIYKELAIKHQMCITSLDQKYAKGVLNLRKNLKWNVHLIPLRRQY